MSVQQLANFANQFLNLNSVCICYKVFTADSFPNGSFKIQQFNNWTVQWFFPGTTNSNPIFEIQSAVAPLCSPLTVFLAEQIWWLEYFPWRCTIFFFFFFYPRSRRQYRTHAELSFEMGSTLSLQGLCKIPLSQLTSFQLRDLMTGSFPLETNKKKSVEARSRGQCRANAELSFEIGSKLSLQWLWKIPFSQLTSFFWLLNMFVWESGMYLYIREVMTR